MSKHIILMADDDADDRYLVQAAFDDNAFEHELVFFEDGDQLLSYLHTLPHQVIPSFILLDLNMPKLDGKDILRVLKSHEQFAAIPIIVFSTSKAPDDVNSCYKLGANSYIVKPSGYEELKDTILKISDFWLKVSIVPSDLV